MRGMLATAVGGAGAAAVVVAAAEGGRGRDKEDSGERWLIFCRILGETGGARGGCKTAARI